MYADESIEYPALSISSSIRLASGGSVSKTEVLRRLRWGFKDGWLHILQLSAWQFILRLDSVDSGLRSIFWEAVRTKQSISDGGKWVMSHYLTSRAVNLNIRYKDKGMVWYSKISQKL